MKFIHLCKKCYYLSQVLTFTVLLFVFFLLITVPVISFVLFRLLLAKLLLRLRRTKDLSKILTSCAHVFAVDNVSEGPNVNVVITLTFKGSLSLEDLRRVFEERVLSLRNEAGELFYPELRQHYNQWLGFLFWKWDTEFCIQEHVRLYDYEDLLLEVLVKEEQQEQEVHLQDLARVNAKLMKRGWAQDKSPWEFLLIPNYRNEDESSQDELGEAGTALIFRFHHGIGDGFGFFNLLWTYFAGAEASLETVEDDYRNLKSNFKPKHSLAFYAFSPVRAHFEYAKQVMDCNDVNEWKVPEEELLRSGLSAMSRRIPVEDIKEIRRFYKISFSGAILGLISGGLRQSMIDCGLQVPSKMHGLLPIPSRIKNRGKLRNYISFIYPELAVGLSDSKSRFLNCDENLKALKSSTLPAMNKLLHQISGSMPVPMVRGFQKNVFATALISIFPGPKKTVLLHGLPMTDITFTTSCHGYSGICISVLSYDSNLRVVVNVNDAVPSGMSNLAQVIVRNIENELTNFQNSQDYIV